MFSTVFFCFYQSEFEDLFLVIACFLPNFQPLVFLINRLSEEENLLVIMSRFFRGFMLLFGR